MNASARIWLVPMVVAVVVVAAAQEHKLGYEDTPMQPNGTWHIHDGNRPQPRVVEPGATVGAPPSDAIVLFGPGGDLSAWSMDDGSPAMWPIRDGALESARGFLRTKQEFGNFQLHVEWATPSRVEGEGQGRGNSGVFLLGKFEVQILDSYRNPTYPDGQAAALYGQYPPLVNASRPPGAWQTYDIIFRAPRFKGTALENPAMATVIHNGVVVHHATAFWGPTAHRQIEAYTPDLTEGPIRLQDHKNPVRFRNIWIRRLSGYDAT